MLVFSQTPEETNIGFKTLHGNITLGQNGCQGEKTIYQWKVLVKSDNCQTLFHFHDVNS